MNEHLQKLEALSHDPSLKVSPEKRSVVVENIRHHLMPVRLETFSGTGLKPGVNLKFERYYGWILMFLMVVTVVVYASGEFTGRQTRLMV